MQSADLLQFGIGALLGISAAPHCLVMCSGVASALALPGAGQIRLEILARGAISNVGRISSYAVAGAVVGGFGMFAFSWLDATLANITLRWLAAILLSIVGLSLVGILPAIILSYPNRMLTRLLKPQSCGSTRMRSYGSLFVAGSLWGFMPCAMAYSALFYATISGSAVRGFLTMSGFGLATLLPMILPPLGISLLGTDTAVKRRTKLLLGFALAAIGIAGTLNAVHDFGVWCKTT